MSDTSSCVFITNNIGGEFAKRTIERLKGYCEQTERKEIELSNVLSEEFHNKEPQVKPLTSIRKKDVHFICCIRQDGTYAMYKDCFEMFCLLDALNRAGAKSINLYIPGMPFMRQDSKFEGREPITAKLFFNLIVVAAGRSLERIITVDLHSKSEQGFVDLPLDDLKAMPLFILYCKMFKKLKAKSKEDIVVVSADSGAVEKNKKFAEFLDMSYFAMPKTRQQGKEAEVALPKESLGFLKQLLKGKTIIIIEDMIDTGGTLLSVNNILQDFKVAEVYVFATHGIFSNNACEKLRKSGIKVLITDTIPWPKDFYEKNKDWLTVVSMSEYFAEAIYANQVADSMSDTIRRKFEDSINGVGDLIFL